MLQLKNVTKVYDTGDSKVQALDGVSIEFRENEFVSILGQSGCGKTTLLNIIGGLDRYTNGDLIINGKSTTDFSDADWDTYRNHSVGFVFQSYNLIPHQTVLANVELALTLSGVSKSERRRRAIEALEKVGLGDQIKKKPNQMSGGQMQRVAIARAIVNDPDILLADEPTGALDTATSIQIMDILREIAKDKLVIMVTHNPEIAEEYSTRIVRLLDGKVTDDSDPYHHEDETTVARETTVKKDKKTSMSFATALSLSLNNLMTKKGRTIMTVFAGSIGIIGIALILSLSNGINSYIDDVQKDTLSSYPIQIDKQTMDMTTMMSNMMSDNSTAEEIANRDPNKIYSNNILSEMMNAMNDGVTVNNLADFKTFIENHKELSDKSVVSAIQYTYGMNMNIYSTDTSGGAIQVNPSRVMSILMQSIGLGATDDNMTASIGSMYGLNVWTEMLDNPELLDSQYELLDPDTMHWPRNYDEVILVVNKNNELSDVALFALGLKDPAEFEKMIATMMDGGSYEIEDSSYTYDDLMNLTYRVVLPTDYFVYDEETDTYIDKSKNEDHIKGLIENGIELKVVGIVRAREGAVSTSISGTVGYTKSLTEFIAREIGKSDLLNSQIESKDVNILTGQEFDKGQYKDLSEEKRAELFLKYSKEKMTNAEKSKIILNIMSAMTDEERESMITSLPEDTKAALMPVDLTEYTDVQLVNYIMLNIAKYPDVYEQFMIDMMDMMFAKILEQMPDDQRPQAEAYYAAMTKEQKLEQIEKQYANKTEQEKEDSLRQTLSLLPREACMVYASAIAQEEMIAKLESNSGSLTEMALLYDSAVSAMDTAQLSEMYGAYMPSLVSEKTYDEVLSTLGMVDLDDPAGIYLYAASFEAKDRIQEIIEEYNKTAEEEGRDGDVISYTDIIGIMMSFFTDVINAISYVLVAFVSISLVVSAIMIGIITYISVLERTKEIGILRAMGASKGDISSVFNAETMIVGFAAGLFGIIATVLMIIPINAIIFALTGIPNIKAILPIDAALILVAISVVLTLVAGLIPSLAAAKKDPVIALRSE